MATSSNGNIDPTSAGLSPAFTPRSDGSSTIPCRNVALYGHCRRPDCTYYHPPTKMMGPTSQPDNAKKRFNVDSPSFTPGGLAANGNGLPSKTAGLSPRAASAAPFKPRSLTPASSVGSFTTSTSNTQKSYNPAAPDWIAPDSQEFHPQPYKNITVDSSSDYTPSDIYSMQDPAGTAAVRPIESQQGNYQFGSGLNGAQPASYMPNSSHQSQLLYHHLYAPLDPRIENNKPYQRIGRDMFIPEDIRLKLHKKTEAILRTFPNSQLPNIEYFHTLTPLEPLTNRNSATSGPQSTVYKAVSDQDGKTYCLRRMHDYRVLRDSDSARAIAMHKAWWSPLSNSSVVKTHLAFTTQLFGDTSIVIVSDFFPDSTTLYERFLAPNLRSGNRNFNNQISELLLWNLLVQMANALKAIHGLGRAARYMDAKRWLLTDDDRVRFNANGLADIFEPSGLAMQDLQRLDLHNLGRLIFSLGTTNAHNKMRPADHFARVYSARMKHAVEWLQQQGTSAGPNSTGTISDFLQLICSNTMEVFDGALHYDDFLQHHLNRELENSRLVRLLLKLNMINDRPEYENDTTWRDQGQRGALKLFRDYVFHQVDANGQPVLDMGHMLACLNKLDVGVDERITLVTRNEQTVVVVSYRELKGAFDQAWAELMRRTAA